MKCDERTIFFLSWIVFTGLYLPSQGSFFSFFSLHKILFCTTSVKMYARLIMCYKSISIECQLKIHCGDKMILMYMILSETWECILKIYFLYFSSKTYVVGTQKNSLNETVLFSTQNTCLNWWVRKSFQFYAQKISLSGSMSMKMSESGFQASR